MESEEVINAKILKITMNIQEKYPELSKFLAEVPVSIPNENHPKINRKILLEYQKSLEILLKKYIENGKLKILNIKDLPGYPLYPVSEDIYKKAIKVEDIDFEEIAKKPLIVKGWNEKTFKEDPFGEDLDVPRSELDDEQETIGNEDEENNFYSLSQDEKSEIAEG